MRKRWAVYMKLSFNKIFLSCLIALAPILILTNGLMIEYDKVDLFFVVIIIVAVICGFYIPNKYVKIGLSIFTIILLVIFINIPGVISGMKQLINRYSEMLGIYNDVTIDSVKIKEFSDIRYLLRAYSTIMIPSLFVVYRNKLWKFVYLTVSVPYIFLVLSFGKVPTIFEINMMAVLYTDILITDNYVVKGDDLTASKCKMYRSIIVIGVSVVTIFGIQLYNTANPYERSSEIEDLKKEINEIISGNKKLSLDGILDLFGGGKGHGGMNGGKLGQVDSIEFSGETVLEVTFPVAPPARVFPFYVKSFVGSVYDGDRWLTSNSDMDDEIEELAKNHHVDIAQIDEITAYLLAYSEQGMFIFDDSYNLDYNLGMYNMSMTIKSKEDDTYPYWPYFAKTNMKSEQDGQRLINSGAHTNTFSSVYFNVKLPSYSDILNIQNVYNEYPAYRTLSNEDANMYEEVYGDFSLQECAEIIGDYQKFAYDNYLTIPESFEAIANEIRNDSYQSGDVLVNFNGVDFKIYGYNYYIKYVKNYLAERCTYTLSPGKLKGGEDFVDKFLNETHEGYCSHFASAATLMFRTMGVPARYVEGYCVDRGLTSFDEYGNATSTLIDVKDDSAHAWVEIFVDGVGWIPVDVTPSGYRDLIKNQVEGSTQTTTANESIENVTTNPPTTTTPVTTTPSATTDNKETSNILGNDDNNNSGENGGTRIDPWAIIKPILIIALIIDIVGTIILCFRVRFTDKQKKFKKIIDGNKYNQICKEYSCQLEEITRILNTKLYYYESIKDLSSLIMKLDDELEDDIVKAGAEALYKYKYSNDMMTANETEDIMKLVKEFTIHIYQKSNVARKFYMRYVKCLYLFGK